MSRSFSRPELIDLDNRRFDLIVVGGGITGAGVAQDAASRGLETLLLEKGDFASGTSSKSTKLIHGGLRYLANLQFGVTMESLSEREIQQKLAPFMVLPVPFVIPCYRGQFLKNLKLRAGLVLYDLMAGAFGRFSHRRISAFEVQSRCPGVHGQGLTGGLLFFDCRTDDARHTLEVVRSAVDFGAVAVNYAAVRGAIYNEEGKIHGVLAQDELTGSPLVRLFADRIVNATGVWAQKTSDRLLSRFDGEVAPAKGIHITVPAGRFPIASAMIIPSVHDNRLLFAVPWYGSVVIGTTDTAYGGDLDSVKVEPEEVDYVLDAVNALFPRARLTTSDITGSYAGLRPLIKQPGAGSTADLSRKHVLSVSDEGLISIAGGKLTTYRKMAEETVDLIGRMRASSSGACALPKSRTARLRLGGLDAGDDLRLIESLVLRGSSRLALSGQTGKYLWMVYGKRALEVLALVREDRKLALPLASDHPCIMAQVVYAVRHESACRLADVLLRRIRLGVTDRRATLLCAGEVGQVMARELSWGDDRVVRELAALEAELG